MGAKFADYVVKGGGKAWGQITAEDEAEKLVIPYKRGRVTFFKSHRLHHTGKCEWQPGYIDRRINLSVLFGRMTCMMKWDQYREMGE